MKPSPLDRVLLLLTAILASYQVAIGIEGVGTFSILAYTIGFGILLIAILLILILGLEVLELPAVVIVSTLLPVSLAVGLVGQYLPTWRVPSLIGAGIGLLAVALTRRPRAPAWAAMVVVALVHGVSGLVLFSLPIVLVLSGYTKYAFLLVSLGSALIGLLGLLLTFLRRGRPKTDLFRYLPTLFFLLTLCFTLGFAFR